MYTLHYTIGVNWDNMSHEQNKGKVDGLNEATVGQPTRYIKHIREKLLVYSTPTLCLVFFLLLL